MSDWCALIQKLGDTPTPVQLLVSGLPTYIIYTYARKMGDSGVITTGLENIPFWVWQYQWTMNIQQALLTEDNTIVTLRINELEIAGMVLVWLVLEYVWHKLIFKRVGLFCNRISSVSWAYKGITST